MCPVPGVSRNEGLDSRFFVTSSGRARRRRAPASPLTQGKGCPSFPVLAAGSSPAAAAEHIWAAGPRLRRCPAEGGVARPRRGCPASGPSPERERGPGLPRDPLPLWQRPRPGRTRLGRAGARPRLPGWTGNAGRRLVLPVATLAHFGRDLAVHLPGVFWEAVWERAPGMELPRPGFGAGCLRAALHLSRVCFSIWSSVKLYPSTP